jgi:hypothetical protein
VTKAADNKVLSDWEYPLEGDILAALLKYYQVRYVMAVLMGKPVREQVVSLWINRTNWEEDTHTTGQACQVYGGTRSALPEAAPHSSTS